MSALTSSDMPGLYQAADAASAKAQRYYVAVVATDLFFMLTGAVLGAISVSGDEPRKLMALASTIAIAIGFVLFMTLKVQKQSSTWYEGRAVAEAAKTSAWRFMMRAHPYGSDMPDAAAEKNFASSMDDLLKDHRHLAGALPAALAREPLISDRMRDVRLQPLNERKALYLDARVSDQQRWYTDKAEYNSSRARVMFALVILCHALALVGAITTLVLPDPRLNLTGVFAALASAFIAWTHLRKYEEMASVYGLTGQALRSAQDRAGHITAQADFSTFVDEAESAIARENAAWLATRDSG